MYLICINAFASKKSVIKFSLNEGERPLLIVILGKDFYNLRQGFAFITSVLLFNSSVKKNAF